MSRTTSWVRSRSRWALAAGLVGTAALALTTTAALGGFTASITNNANAASTGSLVMKEVVGAAQTTCLSTGTGIAGSNTVNATNANVTCPSNKFGGLVNAKPGDSNTTAVAISNVGSITANSLTMGVGTCVPTTNTAVTTYNGSDTAGFCGKVDVTIEDDTAGTGAAARCVYPAQTGACPALSTTYNLATLATAYATPASILPTSTPVLAGGIRNYVVNVGIDASATNADQGLTATQPITFTFGQ